MTLHNLKPVDYFELKRWLLDNIPNLTQNQKDAINDEDGFVRFNKFRVFKKADEEKRNIFLRLTLIPYALIWIGLFLFLPFNFILTGTWKYDKIDWFVSWGNKLF